MKMDELGAQIDRELRTRRFLGYHESRSWAIHAAPVIEAIRCALVLAPSAELVALIERAIGNVIRVILHADDSDGLIGDLARELLDVHAEACDAGVADPVKLARWMVRFSFDDQDFFETDPVRYAAALGDFGLHAYRRAVRKRCDAGDDSFAARYALERLAVLDGDVDEIVRLHGGALNRPYDFIRVAEAMAELGRDDDVLAWAERGIGETSGWQVAQLYAFAAAVHSRRGENQSLLRLRRDQHNRMPSASSYDLLKGAAETLGVWTHERDGARSQLTAHDLGALVDVLLADEELEAAWRVAVGNPDWDPGDRRLMRLAEVREGSHPADALEVYLRLADRELATADRVSYSRGTKILERAARAANAAGMTAEFAEHLLTLRDRYRRRPTMIAMFDKAGLR